jgi:diguanylate cyclase (GGDEF)-like protein
MDKGMDPQEASALHELLARAGLLPEELSDAPLAGGQAFSELLYVLTRMRFGPDEALGYCCEILRHHDGLNLALGRDVGLRVAVCDYFMNLHPKMRDPVIVEVQVLLQKEQGALVDELTGLYNRRYFNDAISREVERFKRFGQRFSLLMLDVDHFKRFNDAFGHTAGDDALKTVADVLRHTARSFDHVVRYGGEEFALILPHTDSAQAVAAAERLRRAVAARPVAVSGQDVSVTVSLGTATFPEDAINARDLVCRADEALYEAKRTRNAVSCFSEKNRRFPRAPVSLMALFVGSGTQGEAEPVRVVVANVSFGGMLCVRRRPSCQAPGWSWPLSPFAVARGRGFRGWCGWSAKARTRVFLHRPCLDLASRTSGGSCALVERYGQEDGSPAPTPHRLPSWPEARSGLAEQRPRRIPHISEQRP